MNQSKVICLVGPSGVGKTSYARRLVEKYGFALPTVITTRKTRADDSRNYQYVTEPTFFEMVKSGALLEWDRYTDHHYGTTTRSVEKVLEIENCPGVVLDLTPKGCFMVMNALPSTVVIAIRPDNPAWLVERLVDRNSQPLEEIHRRTELLNSYLKEIDSLTCRNVYASFSSDSWDATFEKIEKIVFESKPKSG